MFPKPTKILPLAAAELSADLGWMLQSPEVSDAALSETLFQERFGRLYRLAFTLLGRESLARRAADEAIAQAVLNRHRYWTTTRPEVWLYRIAIESFRQPGRVWLANWRAERASKARSQEMAAQTSDEQPGLQEAVRLMSEAAKLRSGCALEGVEIGEAVEQIRPILQWLSENYRLAALLRYGEGFSVAEVAEALGQPLLAAHEWLCEARRRVRGLYLAAAGRGEARLAELDHPEIIEAIDIAANGLLTAEERQTIDAHLAGCPACRQLAECTRLADELLAAFYQRETLPPAPTHDLSERVDESLRRLARQRRRIRFNLSFKELALGAAAVLLTAFVVSRAVTNQETLPTPPPRREAALQAATLQPTGLPSPTAELRASPTLTPTPVSTSASRVPPSEEGEVVQVALSLEETRRALDAQLQPEAAGGAAAQLALALAYWGWQGSSADTAVYLQPNPADVNVMPYEMVSFVEERTHLRAALRYGGDLALLQDLLAGGFPTVIEIGEDPPRVDVGWQSGYALVTGFDARVNRLTLLSGDLRAGLGVDAGGIVGAWRPFNYLYVVVYPQEREEQLMQILGAQADVTANAQFAADKASEEIYSPLGNQARFFAWFNRGVSLTYLSDYSYAAQAFDEAWLIFDRLPEKEKPWQLYWRQSRPYWAYFYTSRFQDVIDLANAVIDDAGEPMLEEALYWRALAREAQGDVTGALADLQLALELNPNFIAGKQQLARIQGGS